ncbi:MAG: hypothetical protein IIC79_06015 [Chloroflexi bacterium]|nr:hypothetical protein [Chloroflexota bacterium]
MNGLLSLLSAVLNSAAVLVELLFSIPVAGRLLKWSWSIVLFFVALVFGIVDAMLWLIGARWEKKLRVGVIILRDENGTELMQPEEVLAGLDQAIATMYAAAKVRVLPVWETWNAPKSGVELPVANVGWVRTNPESSRANVLRVGCDLRAFSADLLTTGGEFEFLMASLNFQGNFRRVSGYGAPLMVFIVDSMGQDKRGCSIGPLSDYVTIVKNETMCIGHELGHACNLLHVGDNDNLMHGFGCKQGKLEWWQILSLRASRHVSYF